MAMLAAFACGEGDLPSAPPPSAAPATREPTSAVPATPEPEPTEFRVAFINLMGPFTADPETREAADTFEERLHLIIAELKAFDPDVVGFNEATRTRDYGDAINILVRELKMEPHYARANPWPRAQARNPGSAKEASDALVKQLGYEEGELVLVKNRWPVIRSEYTRRLTPLTTEGGEGRVALWVRLKGPAAVGDIDIFLAHLTGGGPATQTAQAADLAQYISNKRGTGPVIVMVGQSDPGPAPTWEQFKFLGLNYIPKEAGIVTCCRKSVIGEQPPLEGRNDYFMSKGLASLGSVLFADKPGKRKDGTLLYGSDHNGIATTFALPPPGGLE